MCNLYHFFPFLLTAKFSTPVTARLLFWTYIRFHVVRSDHRLDIGFIDHFYHNSELQVITAPSLIYTLYNSLEFFFSLLCLRQPFPGNGFNSGDSSASALKSSLNGGSLSTDSFLQRIPCLPCNSSERPAQTTPFILVPAYAGIYLPSRSLTVSVFLIKNLFSDGRGSLTFADVVQKRMLFSEPYAGNGCFSDATVYLNRCNCFARKRVCMHRTWSSLNVLTSG
jgi:hypothetical protein